MGYRPKSLAGRRAERAKWSALMRQCVEGHGGNRAAASRHLGISYQGVLAILAGRQTPNPRTQEKILTMRQLQEASAW